MSDVKTIKRILRNRFISDARKQGQNDLAEAIEEILPLLNSRNVKLARGEEVTELSPKVKAEAEVKYKDPFFITTVFPEWYMKGKEKEILEELADKGTVYVGITEGIRYPPDKIVEDMRKRGMIVGIVPPGVISSNISKTAIVLYRSPSPFTGHESKERIAIHVINKPGKILSARFRSAKPFWLPGHYGVFGPPLREFAVLRALGAIVKNEKERKILEDMTRHDDISPSLRILMGLYILQNENDRPYEIDEISRKVRLDHSEITAEAKRWKLEQDTGPKYCEFDLDTETKVIKRIQLRPLIMYQVIPLAFTIIVQNLYFDNGDIRNLAEKYKLPPVHKSSKLLGIWR